MGLNKKASKWQMFSHKREWISVHFLPRTCIIAWITNGATRAAILLPPLAFMLYMRQFVNLFCFNGEEARKGKKGAKQSIKRTRNGLSFEGKRSSWSLWADLEWEATLVSGKSYCVVKLALKDYKKLIKKTSITFKCSVSCDTGKKGPFVAYLEMNAAKA